MRTCKWITILAIWTLVSTRAGFGQIIATLTLPDTSAVLGDTVAVPISVSTDSSIGLAQFVIEFDSTIIQFQNAVIGKDISNFVVSLTNPNLPFSVTSSETNENMLVQISGGGVASFSGQEKEVVALNFIVLNSPDTSLLVFDQTANHTFLTTIGLQDITGGDINFENGRLYTILTDIKQVEEISTPKSYLLHQNYPNPFNPETWIKYELPKSGKVLIKVINILGQEVRTLVAQDKPAGRFEVLWDGKDNAGHRMSSGVYLYRMEAEDFVQTKMMLLLQ